jgi:hydrogenase maturation protease
LRGDDAVGCCAARELEKCFRNNPNVEIMAAQQLTPEMADDIAASQFVLFLDASCGEEPGTIRVTKLRPEPGPNGFTHQLNPSTLLSAVEQLYGDAPEGATITLAGWSFDISTNLSSGARARLPEMVRQARELVESHCVQVSRSDQLLHTR